MLLYSDIVVLLLTIEVFMLTYLYIFLKIYTSYLLQNNIKRLNLTLSISIYYNRIKHTKMET
jgi:hypothetical protein